MNGWISVDERLPDNADDVLVTDGYDCSIAYMAQIGRNWLGRCDGGPAEDYEHRTIVLTPTHWMPLPEQPK